MFNHVKVAIEQMHQKIRNQNIKSSWW